MLSTVSHRLTPLPSQKFKDGSVYGDKWPNRLVLVRLVSQPPLRVPPRLKCSIAGPQEL